MGNGADQHASGWWRARSVAALAALSILVIVVAVVTVQDRGDDSTALALPATAGDLTFDTPEQALDNFLEAFNTGDYELSVHMLTVDTINATGLMGSADGLTTLAEDERYPSLDSSGLGDLWFTPANIVGELLEQSAAAGSLPIDLRDGIDDRMTTITETDGATITGRLGDGEPVTVSLARNDSDEWRIEQFSVQGGDPDHRPFSALAGNEPPPIEPTGYHYAERFEMTSPQQFAELALRLVEAGDGFSLELLLGFDAWNATLIAMNDGTTPRGLVTPAGRNLMTVDELLAAIHQWGGLLPAIWERAVEVDAMYIDPVGPFTIVTTEPDPTDDHRSIVTVMDDRGTTYQVTVIDVGDQGFRLHQILADGGDPELLPFSGPTNVEILPGTELCWDHVRFDCDRSYPVESIPELAAAIESARESDEPPAVVAAEIASLEFALIPDLDQMCATMQGWRNDLTFPQSWIDLAPVIIEEHCPGDPSLLTLDPTS